MAIGAEFLDSLDLIRKVDNIVKDCYTSWRVAAVAALTGFQAPDDRDQARQWWIAAAGDLLWAVVFNPEVTIVVKAASMIGASLG